jgi:hypothetical protein
MFILTADQVTPYQAIHRQGSHLERLLAIVYQNWRFIKGESYSSQELDLAIKQTRTRLDSGEMCILVRDIDDNYIICYENQEIELVEEETSQSGENLEKIVEEIRNTPGLIKNNRYKLRIYPQSFLGKELVDFLCNYLNCSREEAVKVGQSLLEQGWLHHTWDDHNFKDEPLLYRFYQDEKASLPFITK